MSSLISDRVFVGLDYHQNSVQVCLMNTEGGMLLNRSCPNDAKQIAAMVAKYSKAPTAAIESCCGAANLSKELRDAGWNISLAHAGFVARMKQNPDKTDFGDARILADLVRVGYLPKVWLAPDAIVELRRLVRFRQQLVDERRSVKLRIRARLRDQRLASPEDCGKPWTKRWLGWLCEKGAIESTSGWILQQQIDRLTDLSARLREAERRLETLVADDAMVRRLREFKSIGLITAATMRAEIGEFDRFHSGKQLARFCGLCPQNASSGERQSDSGLIKAGNPQLRAVLAEAAHRLLWSDPRWAAFGTALLRRGKPKSVVVAAVANRWIRWLYHQLQPDNLAA